MEKKRNIDIFFRVWRIAAGCLTGLVIIAVLLKIIPGFLGYQSYIVLSGSMEPTLPVGSVVYADSRNNMPDIGDIAVYQVSDSVRVTHRVIDVSENGYILKGDANNAPDFSPVPKNRIIGVYALHIPMLGYILSMFQGAAAIVTLIILILINILPDIRNVFKKNRERS